MTVDTVFAGLAAIAASLAAIFAFHQSLQLKRTIHLQATVELMRQYTVDFWKDRIVVDFDLAKRIPRFLKKNPRMGFDELPKRYRDAARRISFFFDFLGFLVIEGYVSERTFISFLGGSAITHYGILGRLIENERKKRGQERFQLYFEDFVRRSVRIRQAEMVPGDRLNHNELRRFQRYWKTGKWIDLGHP